MLGTPPTLNNPPTPPSRSDAANFASRADAFLGWFVTAWNDLAAALANVYANALDAYNSAQSANLQAGAAAASASAAATSATAAQTAAQSAINAPGTAATSSSSLAIGLGYASLAIQPGKAFTATQFVLVSAATPGNWMLGQIASYDPISGALVVGVVASYGAGTYAAWTVTPSAPIVQAGIPTADLLRAKRRAVLALVSQ